MPVELAFCKTTNVYLIEISKLDNLYDTSDYAALCYIHKRISRKEKKKPAGDDRSVKDPRSGLQD